MENQTTKLDLQDEISYIKCKLFYLTESAGNIISEYENDIISMGFILNMEAVIKHLDDLSLKINNID